MKEKVFAKIEELQDEIVNYASEIVKFPTLSGQELEAQKYLKGVLEDLNFDNIDMWEPEKENLKDHESFITKRKDFKGSPNLVGVLKGTGGGRSLVFNSHIDIVPAGDLDEWNYSPFDGTVDKGNIYGRGISDMKGTKASFLGVVKAFKELGIKLKGDLIFESVIEEETGSAGSLACALRGYRADAAIVPEPTGFKICPAQQGAAWFRVHIQGKSAHAGQRYKGVSAIDKAYLVISAIKELEKRRNEEYKNPLYKNNPIPFTINVGTIQGGDWPSSVPEKVVLEVRMAIPPGETVKEARASVEKWINNAAKKDDWLKDHLPVIEWFGAFWGSAQIESDHPIVEVSKNAYREIMNKEPEVEGTPWGTDAHILTRYADTPALVFGPGVSAHCPDEYLPVKDLIDYTKILATVILEWCNG